MDVTLDKGKAKPGKPAKRRRKSCPGSYRRIYGCNMKQHRCPVCGELLWPKIETYCSRIPEHEDPNKEE